MQPGGVGPRVCPAGITPGCGLLGCTWGAPGVRLGCTWGVILGTTCRGDPWLLWGWPTDDPSLVLGWPWDQLSFVLSVMAKSRIKFHRRNLIKPGSIHVFYLIAF